MLLDDVLYIPADPLLLAPLGFRQRYPIRVLDIIILVDLDDPQVIEPLLEVIPD